MSNGVRCRCKGGHRPACPLHGMRVKSPAEVFGNAPQEPPAEMSQAMAGLRLVHRVFGEPPTTTDETEMLGAVVRAANDLQAERDALADKLRGAEEQIARVACRRCGGYVPPMAGECYDATHEVLRVEVATLRTVLDWARRAESADTNGARCDKCGQLASDSAWRNSLHDAIAEADKAKEET